MVEALGPGTSGHLAKGQRVVAADWGEATYQEYVAVDEKHLVLCTMCDEVLSMYMHPMLALWPVQPPHSVMPVSLCRPQPCHNTSESLEV